MSTGAQQARRFPIGAELIGPGKTSFRVWAPKARELTVVIDCESAPCYPLAPEKDGYLSGLADVAVGARYWFRIDGGKELWPDVASRFQPEGPHGSSQVIDPSAFAWTDANWRGIRSQGQVIYELHVGTFTNEGTWAAAARELAELAQIGITVIEMMPICDFPGRFGWGYDGVALFAPTHQYGSPDDLRAFIDQAHAVGIGVILDVVYNHVGPDGNYLEKFSEDYFTDRYQCEWGKAINFDGPNCAPVREFFIANACYWITEFHFDGFRFDATQSIFDSSPEPILAAVATAARRAAGKREIFLVGENEPQDAQLIRPAGKGGSGLNALWNDDLHHTALVALSGRTEAYYADYKGSPQEFISAAKRGFLYQGQNYRWQKKRRGTPSLNEEPTAFIGYLDNHDQVANSGFGQRSHVNTSPGRFRALTALLLLGPWTPMLFQGQEFCASSPFLYFGDLNENLRKLVRNGRTEFLSQFPSIASEETRKQLADPSDSQTFERSKLDFRERESHAMAYALHCDLLKLRRDDPRFYEQRRGGVDGAVLGGQSFVLRYFSPTPDGHDRLLIVNLGMALELNPAPEPLLAPPEDKRWETHWSSEAPRYGGPGMVPLEDAEDIWKIPAEAAVVLRPTDVSV